MSIRLGSPLARFAAFAVPAIVLPAAVLAVLGYLSLRQWETSAELLFKEQARDMAAMGAEKVEMVLLRTEDEILSRIQAPLKRSDFTPEAFRALRATAPLIDRLYLFDRRGQLLFPSAWPKADAEIFSGPLAEISRGFRERARKRHFVAGDQLILAAILKRAGGAPVLALLSLKLEVLRREVLEPTLGRLEGPSIPAVIDHRDRPIYSREPLDRADRIVTVTLGKALPLLAGSALSASRDVAAGSGPPSNHCIHSSLRPPPGGDRGWPCGDIPARAARGGERQRWPG